MTEAPPMTLEARDAPLVAAKQLAELALDSRRARASSAGASAGSLLRSGGTGRLLRFGGGGDDTRRRWAAQPDHRRSRGIGAQPARQVDAIGSLLRQLALGARA
jgi:hypothetical protein